jgi:peptidyl-prolyl cis-trans isomerase SurA
MPFPSVRLFLSCALLAVATASAEELSTSGVLLDRVAAVVNDGIVLQSDLDQQSQLISQRIQQQGQQPPPRNVLRQQVLERLVLQELQLQRADRLGIQITDEMLNTALTDVAGRNNIKFSDLPAALEQQGVDYRNYRDEMRKEMMLTALHQRDVYSRIYVSPRELEQCVVKRKASPAESEEYNLAHILVAVPESADTGQVAERTARAEGVYERARAGEDFAQLAIAYSDAGTALEGGALGWRNAGQLPSFVADLIPKMRPGEVTEPIRSPSGLHLFKLLEVRGTEPAALVSQVHARHILLETNEIEDDETVRQKLSQIRSRIIGGENFEAIASVTSADVSSAAHGGDLDWQGPGTFVPEFEQQLDRLSENEISEPFKTNFGWHIVQLLGRRTYDATDDVIRNRCYAQMREARADEETELWLRRLRDEAFIEYRM